MLVLLKLSIFSCRIDWLVLCFSGAVLLAAPSLAQDPIERAEALEFFQHMTRTEIEGILDVIEPALDKAELRILSEIEFRVPLEGGAFGARAFLENERPVVVLSGDFSRSLFMVVDAFVIGHDRKLDEFAWNYICLIADSWARNLSRGQQGLKPLKVVSPYEQLGFGPRDYARLDKELSEVRGGAFFQNLAFVVTHEVAHHVLGHLDEEQLGGDRDPLVALEERIEYEGEADRWATETLIRAGLAPMSGIHALLYLYVLDQEAIRHELVRAHPADIRRMRRMVDITVQVLRKTLSEKNFDSSQIDAIEENFRNILRGLEKEIAATTR